MAAGALSRPLQTDWYGMEPAGGLSMMGNPDCLTWLSRTKTRAKAAICCCAIGGDSGQLATMAKENEQPPKEGAKDAKKGELPSEVRLPIIGPAEGPDRSLGIAATCSHWLTAVIVDHDV